MSHKGRVRHGKPDDVVGLPFQPSTPKSLVVPMLDELASESDARTVAEVLIDFGRRSRGLPTFSDVVKYAVQEWGPHGISLFDWAVGRAVARRELGWPAN